MLRRAVLVGALGCASALAEVRPPAIVGVFPLSGRAGTTVEVEISGERLTNAALVEFDCQDLVWLKTTHSNPGKVAGSISILPSAALGPHLLRVVSPDGYSTSALFNVTGFVTAPETEPNDETAQRIAKLPVEIQGRLNGAPDIDQFSFPVKAGERWVFDLRAIEHGSAVEARMILFDPAGRQIEFNDDRGDWDENPLLEHTFGEAGVYTLKLDQYRGPRGFNFGKNNAYSLRISQLPAIEAVSPLGMPRGRRTRIELSGRRLDRVDAVYLTEARLAEISRMTFPYTMPITFRADPPHAAGVARIEGRIAQKRANRLEVDFDIPTGTQPGLWRLWAAGRDGVAESLSLEVSELGEFDEHAAGSADWRKGPYVLNGTLAQPGERDRFTVEGKAGVPLHFWTLAAQLGTGRLDTVLTIRDSTGKRLAENDDVVGGQGSLIGNPDSSLFYTPAADGPVHLELSDRTRRGGPGYIYRLKVKSESPSFQLFTTPENFAVDRGGKGLVKVHLVREADFKGEVSIWFEGLPEGVAGPTGKFRADQLFEPNADGADMIIPEITFPITVPGGVAAKTYPIRVMGCATAEMNSPDRRVVEAHTAVMIGPLLDIWNYSRRPLPATIMTVVEPFAGAISAHARTLSLEPGGTATLELKLEQIAETAPLSATELPDGVSYRVSKRSVETAVIELTAAKEAKAGSFEIYAEALVGARRVVAPVTLRVEARKEVSSR